MKVPQWKSKECIIILSLNKWINYFTDILFSHKVVLETVSVSSYVVKSPFCESSLFFEVIGVFLRCSSCLSSVALSFTLIHVPFKLTSLLVNCKYLSCGCKTEKLAKKERIKAEMGNMRFHYWIKLNHANKK